MNNTNITASLDDTKELRKIITENPELPILIFAGEESYTGEYSCNLADVSKIEVKEIAYDGELYVEKEEYKDKLYDELTCLGVDKKSAENTVQNTEFLKAIVIYVG